jgi:hypothetical protein
LDGLFLNELELLVEEGIGEGGIRSCGKKENVFRDQKSKLLGRCSTRFVVKTVGVFLPY